MADIDDELDRPLSLQGVDYEEFLGVICRILQPRTYLEIGTNTGGSLKEMACDAICIDPAFDIAQNPLGRRRRSFFFQMKSDEFFAQYDVGSFFPEGLDLAFLDGMHRFEFLLRDLMAVERACHGRSLILLHDCLPANTRMAEREMRGDMSESVSTRHWWTGDVWRILPILKKYRPDLRIHVLDCPPTGLVAISRADPANSVLAGAYHDILSEFSSLDLASFGFARLGSLFPVLKTSEIGRPEVLTSVLSVR